MKSQYLTLNKPGFLYLNESLLNQIRDATGDEGQGTVDELKFSPLYDKMSELLFPWCSTLTSRARYFYFSYAVLKLALERTITSSLINCEINRKEAILIALKKRSEFQSNIRKIEKNLALSLVLKDKGLGIFGKIKTERWLRENRAALNAKQHSRILSIDGRYPNAIYRASCRKLGMFAFSSLSIELMANRISAQNPFSLEWENAGHRTYSEVENLDNFWQDNDLQAIGAAAKNFEKSGSFRVFRGFNLSDTESEHLFKKIKESTPYWGHLDPKKLKKLLSADPNFADLISQFRGQAEVKYFEAAEHIDFVTRFFREQYAEICKNPSLDVPIDTVRANLDLIKKSKNWLDKNSSICTTNDTWQSDWKCFYSQVIEDWITLANKKSGGSQLNRSLMARAEEVVADRGRGKEAPHQRFSKLKTNIEEDISQELGVVPTSFRLRNASLILKDVSEGFKNA